MARRNKDDVTMQEGRHNNDTFLTKRITNSDIYDLLLEMKTENSKIKKTASKALFVSTTALSITLMVLAFLLQHINK